MNWVQSFEAYLSEHGQKDDAAHDLAHFRRVYRTALRIAEEDADSEVLSAAAYFHDLVSLPKNHPERNQSSYLAAQEAEKILAAMNFPAHKLKSVFHAIHAHSFSANVKPNTIEAKIIQDADRIEALGALGIVRCLYIGAKLGRECYHPTDFFGTGRELNDQLYTIDHFFIKLFNLQDLFQTEKGRDLAVQRTEFMREFVEELSRKMQGPHTLLQTLNDAVNVPKSFFHLEDPFAEKRKLEDQYIVDKLIANSSNNGYIKKFLAQLKEEVYC